MELPIIHVLHLKRRVDRYEPLIRQMEMEKAPYKIWDAIEAEPAKIGCSRSHKMIVRWAKENKLDFVVNGEDDLRWTGSGAYKYYIENMPKEFHVYLGGSYAYTTDENFKIKKFNGTTLMTIHNSYYDTFLELPETINLDNALSMKGGDFYVSPKVVCKQSPGYSDNVKRHMDYDYLWKNKSIYK